MNYDTFEHIKLEDLDLIRCNKLDCVYNLLTKNGITNLKELFELDDLDLIEYGKKTSLQDRVRNYQTKGIVKLLRSKYLKEDLPYIDLLKTKIIKGKLLLDGELKDGKKYVDELLKLGLTFDFIMFFRQSVIYIESEQLIDLLEKVYKKELDIKSNREYEKNVKRLSIIINGYYKTKNKTTKEKLENLKEQTIKIKENTNNIIILNKKR